jgi:hypothetical protein
MGMFDMLRIAVPDGHVPADGLWQTKDFDCDLDVYEVRDGKLWVTLYESGESHSVNHTGVINFYDYIHGTGLLEWYAEFRDGELVEVRKRESRASHDCLTVHSACSGCLHYWERRGICALSPDLSADRVWTIKGPPPVRVECSAKVPNDVDPVSEVE